MYCLTTKSWRAPLLMAALALFQLGALANHTELDFFEPVTTPSGQELPLHAIERMARPVRVVSKLLERDGFNLNLFPGHSFQVQRDRLEDYGNGDFVWIGRIAGEPLSRVTFASRGGVISGVVDRALDNGNELYELSPTADGGYLLFQADESRLPQRAPGARPNVTIGADTAGSSTDTSAPLVTAEATAAAPAVQDIMVLYTPASMARYAQSGIESMILQAIADANTAYRNSQVNAQLNLVYMGLTSYAETGDMGAALSALQSATDGKMDEVHSLRNQVGADLVCLVDEDPNYCGIAYVMQTVSTSFASYAFSVVNSGCLSSLTLPHEVGHNQGNQHDRANASFQGVSPYSYGWRRCMTDGTGFRTIMSYSCTGGTRVAYFSNPNLTLSGYPLGVAYELDPANAADNVRSMNNTAATMAAFRTSAVTAPATPSGLAASAFAYNQINLTWTDNANNESNYYVERSLDAANWTLSATLPAGTVSFSSTGLSASTIYYYRVRASNSAGFSSYSASASALTPPAPAPSVPTAPGSLAATAVSTSQINLTWSDLSSNENGFAIQRSTDNVAFFQIATVSANVTSYSNTGLATSTIYYFRVLATNSVGSSLYSNVASTTTQQTVTLPAAPSNLAASAISGTQIRLTWTQNSANETGFRIERSLNSSNWSEVGTVGSDVISYTGGSLSGLTTYYYRVRASNSAGNSAYSNVASARTKRR